MRRISIQWKITSLIVFILAFSLLLLGIVLISQLIQKEEDELKERAILTARTVSELPGMVEQLSLKGEKGQSMKKTIEDIRVINQADYIVVLNMDRVRLTHPIESLVGKVSKGKDEAPAFAEHSYTSKAKGEIGVVIRAFVPVINDQHEQIGVVVSGYKLPSIGETLLSLKKEILLTSALALIVAGWGAYLLARHIKREMFQLEPHEIARILVERTETFNAMHEGIIAIDSKERITIFNNQAKRIMGVSGDVIHQPIRQVLPDTFLPEILEKERPVYNRDLHIQNRAIVSNRVPIKVNGKTVGAIAIFQDRTKVKQMAEELTSVKSFVNALRVQNHEHMNKLHTIAGLIQLGNKEKALEYIFQVTGEQEELMNFLSRNIHDESISGLLLSKVSRGKELGIQVTIDGHSTLKQLPPALDHHDFVIVLGNLIENAFDAFTASSEDNQIYVSIRQTEEAVSVLVEDNGCGIPEDKQKRIFEHGYSTKSSVGRGIGLFLIKQVTEKGHGNIQVESKVGQGTTISIIFPMS
ncbi:ATP-binding protein [Bacillus xiapuensis]|uniref:ATP-binding protein n=1 Tax=Bacillus xiapuensis TaxID=2014075 RepID=UPI000C24AA5D|nr:sensor histidine kinase [Bacillus xiapuensis]